jgi:hypothetical protein
MGLLDSLSCFYQIDTQLKKFNIVLIKKLPKTKIESEIFKRSLLTNGFDLEGGVQLFVKILRCRIGLIGHFLYLIFN